MMEDTDMDNTATDDLQVARIIAFERLAAAILHDLPDAMRSDGCKGLDNALERAGEALNAWRALT